MGDIGKGPPVHQHRRMLQGLDQVRLHGILQKGRHGAHCLQIPCRHRIPLLVIGHDDPGQTFLQVAHILRQAEDSHDFAGHGDDKVVFPHVAVHLAAEPYHNIPEHSVVHVHAALPDNLPAVYPQLVPLLDMVVQKRRQQVVGGGDCVEIPCEVKVQLLHGHHLGISAPGGSPFDAEAGTQRWLPQRHHSLLPKLPECLA